MDSNIGQAHSSNDDDDFVVPPPRRHESSAHGKSPVVEGLTTAHHSQSHGAQQDGVSCHVSQLSIFPSLVTHQYFLYHISYTSGHRYTSVHCMLIVGQRYFASNI